jgi:hypothetical protein
VVAQILSGFAEVHGDDVVPHRDALIERREDTQAELAGQGRLA